MTTYLDFLRAKMKVAPATGFDVDDADINPDLAPHCRAIVKWALQGGRRGIFAAFGLHKTSIQLELMRLIGKHVGGRRLIVLPLGVRHEFFAEAEERFRGEFAIELRFVRRDDEVTDDDVIHIANYESVRDGKIDPRQFVAAALDEAAILRGYGTKTYQTFLPLFEGVRFKFVATATPSPNRTKELIHYAGFLQVMDTGQALTRFFQRNSSEANELTLYPHKEDEFWLWVNSWAVFLQSPADLGFPDEGYVLPEMIVNWHEVHTDHRAAGIDRDGQGLLINDPGASVVHAAREKRVSMDARLQCMSAILQEFFSGDEELQPRVLREEPGERETAVVEPVSPEQGQDRPGEEEGLHGRVPEDIQEAAAHVGRALRTKSPQAGTVRKRSGAQGKTARAGEAEPQASAETRGAPETRVRPDARGVSISAGRAGRRVRDLPNENDGLEGARQAGAVAARRPLPQDEGGEGYSLPPLQLRTGPLSRQPGPTGDSSAVSQVVVWCHLNDEQDAAEIELGRIGITHSSMRGAQSLDRQEELIDAWKRKETEAFIGKPVMFGAGVNLQQCHKMVFLGIDAKFHDFVQAVHRIVRFGQQRECTIDIIYSEAERGTRRIMEEKWAEHERMMDRMTEIIRKYGLGKPPLESVLKRSIGVERRVEEGDYFHIALNDCVDEANRTADDSVGQVITSIPFANHYEYTASYNDFGHTDDNDHFWGQMDFLTPELLRILKPGRLACIHVKDRVQFGNVTGAGLPTISPFHAEAIFHFRRHGFDYCGMITVDTDVVTENNGNYRLGYTEMLKDGSKMGVGSPEYVLLFHKPQSDRTKGYADERVSKSREEYSLARWQLDAHAHWRSSGNRLLTREEWAAIPPRAVPKAFRAYSDATVYDHEEVVAIGEVLQSKDRLPTEYMALAPVSHSPWIWSDVVRMKTLNGSQSRRNVELHICPLQIDIVDRLIDRYSNPGDVVYDPFGGLMTVPYRAIAKGRYGMASELNDVSFKDGVHYCQEAEAKRNVPSFFDLLEGTAPPIEPSIDDLTSESAQ